jgi:hypothetical protein
MSSCNKYIKIAIQSEEQEAEILTLCDWNNWEYEVELNTAKEPSTPSKLQITGLPAIDSHTQQHDSTGGPSTATDDSTAEKEKAVKYDSFSISECLCNQQGEQEYQDKRDGECPHCFCLPCITTYQQAWLGNGQQPRAGNNIIRKKMYRNFWKMLDRRGAWIDPRYLQKEQTLFQQAYQSDSDESFVTVNSVRRVMPECVLIMVRQLYPNPEKIPYMGHKWE